MFFFSSISYDNLIIPNIIDPILLWGQNLIIGDLMSIEITIQSQRLRVTEGLNLRLSSESRKIFFISTVFFYFVSQSKAALYGELELER